MDGLWARYKDIKYSVADDVQSRSGPMFVCDAEPNWLSNTIAKFYLNANKVVPEQTRPPTILVTHQNLFGCLDGSLSNNLFMDGFVYCHHSQILHFSCLISVVRHKGTID